MVQRESRCDLQSLLSMGTGRNSPQRQIYILFWRGLTDRKRKPGNELTFRQGTRCKLDREVI